MWVLLYQKQIVFVWSIVEEINELRIRIDMDKIEYLLTYETLTDSSKSNSEGMPWDISKKIQKFNIKHFDLNFLSTRKLLNYL